MGAAGHILLVNLTVLGVATGGFLASWFHDRTRQSALWTAVALLLLVASGMASLLVLVSEHPSVRLLIHGLTFAGLLALTIGLRLHYGRPPGFLAVALILASGMTTITFAVSLPRGDAAYLVLLNLPALATTVLMVVAIWRARERDALDALLAAGAVLTGLQFAYRGVMPMIGFALSPTVAGYFISAHGLHILTVQCVVTILAVAALALVHVRDTVRGLERVTERDPMTGLLNRRGLDAAVEGVTSRKARSFRPVSVVVTDIDRFKAVNDTHGHEVGDRVIRALASLLGGTARSGDLVARMGGEEFVVVMSDASPDLARLFAEGVRIALSEMPQATGGRVTASFGVAEVLPGMTVPEAIAAADMALYEAKRAGRNRVRVAGAAADERRSGERRGAERRANDRSGANDPSGANDLPAVGAPATKHRLAVRRVG